MRSYLVALSGLCGLLAGPVMSDTIQVSLITDTGFDISAFSMTSQDRSDRLMSLFDIEAVEMLDLERARFLTTAPVFEASMPTSSFAVLGNPVPALFD